MDTMHAVRGHRRGGPERLTYEIAPRPVPGPGEVLVGVRSASITPGELDWDATWTDSFDGSGGERVPIVPSKEVSGVVVELGDDVSDWKVGDEVYGLIPFTRDGAAAEFVAVPAAVLAAKPARLDHDHAAALPLAGLTAWQGLVLHGGLRPGARVLVQGARAVSAPSRYRSRPRSAPPSPRRPTPRPPISYASWAPSRSSTTGASASRTRSRTSTWSSTRSAATPRSAPGRCCVPGAAW